jgi:tetratricopeptide (TPR) repeat protein
VSRAARREPRGWLLLTLLLLAVAGVYAPTLGAPFVWDDLRLVSSPELRRLDLTRAFREPFWFGAPGEAGSSAFFRPLTSLSFGVDYRLHAENAAGYHLSNLAFHLLGTGVLFALLRRRGLSAIVAGALSIWWALLPRLTEGVAWISGRGDVLAGLFALGALWAFRAERAPRLVLAGVLALSSALSKESGLATFAALAVLYGTAPRASAARSARVIGWLALALPLALYAGLRFNAGASAGDALPLRTSLRAYAVLEAVGRYALMVFEPFSSRTFMGRLGQPSWSFVGLGLVVVLAAMTALPRVRRARPDTLAYAALALVPLALVVHVVPLPVTVVASDRYLYLPTLGLVLSVAVVVQRWLAQKRWLLVVPLSLALLGATRTATRVTDYTDETAFWLAAAEGAPREATPLVELGTQAYSAGCYPEATRLYGRALGLNDFASPRGLENAALLASLSGDRARAAQLGDILLRRFPGVASLQLRRAQLALAALDFDSARTHARRASELSPQFTQAKGFLRMLEDVQRVWSLTEAHEAPIEARLGVEMRALRYPEVVATMRELLERPDSDERVVREGLGFVLRVGRVEDARALLRRYRERRPSADLSALVAALQAREQAAANVRHRLRDLPAATD